MIPEPKLQFSQTGVYLNPIKSSNPIKYLHLGVWGWKTSFEPLRGSKDLYAMLLDIMYNVYHDKHIM